MNMNRTELRAAIDQAKRHVIYFQDPAPYPGHVQAAIRDMWTAIGGLLEIIARLAVQSHRMQGATVPYCGVCGAYGSDTSHADDCVLTGPVVVAQR